MKHTSALILFYVTIILTSNFLYGKDLNVSSLSAPCESCHGKGGGSTGIIPPINQFTYDELRMILTDFKLNKLQVTIMNRIMRGFSVKQINMLAKIFAKKTP